MKKLILLLTTLILPMLAGAQAQINTKKVKVADFTEKVTKVVLGGNGLYDLTLKEEVAARWRISPFEFCTGEEFEQLKDNELFYFLLLAEAEEAPGILFLRLVKGGAGAEKGIEKMLEVVSVPLTPKEEPTGREFAFLPALIDIIQDHTLISMESDVNAYGGLDTHNANIHESGEMTIYFPEEDISKAVDEEMKRVKFDDRMFITNFYSPYEADYYMENYEPNTLVSYVVTPAKAPNGSYCYKMLIGADNHKLYYYRRHKISKKFGAGFLPDDINKITLPR